MEIERKGGPKVNRDSRNKGNRKIVGLAKKTNWQNHEVDKSEKKEGENNSKRGEKRKKVGQDRSKVNDKQQQQQQQQMEAVMFIPYTHRSQLKKELQRWDDEVTKSQGIHRIRFIEVVCRNNPCAARKCMRGKCEICRVGKQLLVCR